MQRTSCVATGAGPLKIPVRVLEPQVSPVEQAAPQRRGWLHGWLPQRLHLHVPGEYRLTISDLVAGATDDLFLVLLLVQLEDL